MASVTNHPHSINAFLSHRDDPRLGRRLALNSNLPVKTPSGSQHVQPGTSLLHNSSQTGHGSLAALTTASSGSRKTGSVSTSYGVKKVRVRTLELDHEGALQIAPLRDGPIYECPFDRLDCQVRFTNYDDWCNHSLTHFGGVAPPKTNRCCFCEQRFHDSTGWRSWTRRMEHTELHHRLGHTLAISRPDFELYGHLLKNGVINSDKWDTLVGRSVSASHMLQPLPSSRMPSLPSGSSRPTIEMNDRHRRL